MSPCMRRWRVVGWIVDQSDARASGGSRTRRINLPDRAAQGVGQPYSRSPAASRASAESSYVSHRIARSSRSAQT